MSLEFDRTRVTWWAVGAVLAAVTVFILQSFVGTFVFGLFLYYATRPLYRRLDAWVPSAVGWLVPRRIGDRVPWQLSRRLPLRSVAAALSLALFALPVLGLLSYTLAVALQQLRAVSRTVDLGPVMSFVRPYLDVSTVVNDPASVLNSGGLEAIQATLSSTLRYVGFVGTGLLHLFVMLALAFYLLRDGERLASWTLDLADDDTFETFARAVDRNFHDVFFGNILNAIMTGIIGAISFSLLSMWAPSAVRLPYPALIGLLAGLASLVPVVGMKIVYLPVAAYLGFEAAVAGDGWWFVGAFAAVSFVVVDTIPDLILRPYVSGQDLHVGAIMFAYIFGPLLFGWYGLFLGPLVLVLLVQFARIVLPELMMGMSVRPEVIDVADAPGEPSERATPDDPPEDETANTSP
ncbi:MAG: AI-2E family transporter [Salinirussus sp.]